MLEEEMKFFSFKIRKYFLIFFKSKSHKLIFSASLLSNFNKTIFFINAGMVPFKNIFMGIEYNKYKLITTCQKCLRVGGKHNDLDIIGRTIRHHTFFEMLGNFSFGFYFKEKACIMAWEFLTKKLKLNELRINVTVFRGNNYVSKDKETIKIWNKIIGLDRKLILEKSSKNNFWSMGEYGPCGPCSEINYNRIFEYNEKYQQKNIHDYIIEIWNIVFIQYNKEKNDNIKLLENPCIDTGMGLERLTMIVNKLNSNYETDLFKPIINCIVKYSNKEYKSSNSSTDISVRIIADHVRSISFLISEGIFPSNDGKGYILRKIIRRALKYGFYLGFNRPFLFKICLQVFEVFKKIYSKFIFSCFLVKKLVLLEEEIFKKTLKKGLNIFKYYIKNLKKNKLLDGSLVYKLYETYGLPFDLTKFLAKKENINIIWNNFYKARYNHKN